MSSALRVMTVSQYALHRACSASYVRRLRRLGRLVSEGKLIVVAASDAALAATEDPLRGGSRMLAADTRGEALAPPEQTGAGSLRPIEELSLREAMRRERLASARLAELRLGETAKQLVRVRFVERSVFTLARQALQRLRTMGSRLREQLAAESDHVAVQRLIDVEVGKIAEEMQHAGLEIFRHSSKAIDEAGKGDSERVAA